MADVVAIIVLVDVTPMICGRCYCHLIILIVWQMESHSGRCYDHIYWVIGRCYCHCGRWSSHIGEWQMLLPLWQMEWQHRIECFWLWQMLLPLWQMEWPLCQLPYLFILFYFKFLDVKQNLIPYVMQMVFAYVFDLGQIVDHYVYCFFYKPCDMFHHTAVTRWTWTSTKSPDKI